MIQVREVELRYTARLAGVVDDVYACRVYGMVGPLGFALTGTNKVRLRCHVKGYIRIVVF